MAALREIIASFGIEVDDSKLKKGEAGIDSFVDKLKEVGAKVIEAFAIKEVVEFAHGILENADALAKQSQALGVSAAALQGWQWAAQLSGSSAEEFTGAFTKFNRNVEEASKGTGPAADAFKALGVNIKDATGKVGQPIDLLDGVADALSNMQDPAKRTATVMALFGKGANKLMPLFLEGSEGIKKLRDEVGELGASFDDQFLEDAQEVNDNLDRLKLGAKGLATQGLKVVLPYITEFSKQAVAAVKAIIPLVKNSNAFKAALVLLGAVAAEALLPLLIGIAPLVAGFLLLEDAMTFLSGGDSLIGDWIEKSFGKGAAEKVRAFFNSIKESGITDALMALKGVFAIFTDDKPLSTKFEELMAFIEGTLRPQLKKDFGEVGDQIALWTELLSGTLAVLNSIIDAMKWIGGHSIGAVGKAVFESGDASANEDARAQRRKDDGETSWYDRLRNFVSPSAQTLAPLVEQARNAPGAPKMLQDTAYLRAPEQAVAPVSPVVTTAAAANQSIAPPIQQENRTSITQNFYTDTPKEMQTAASNGAADGVKKGAASGAGDLLAAQAAIKKTGG